MKNFKSHLQSLFQISDTSLGELEKITTKITFDEGATILPFSKIQKDIFFVEKGILRIYAKKNEQEEINQHINFEGDFLASIESLLFKKPSNLAIQALTNVNLIKIPYKSFTELSQKNAEIGDLHVKILEQICLEIENKIFTHLSHDAKERYIKLRKDHKNIDNLISQYHIASYLGITPIQLSRIRKRLITES